MAKIKKITVSNLKAVSKLSADFNGCTAIITGGNNKGKSSFLRSLPDRLRGVKPEMILKHNEKDGFAEWELTTGEKFMWVFDGKKEKLTYISERNIPANITKEISTHYFPKVFDVDKFLSDPPAKQSAELQKLSGLDFSEVDRAYRIAYDQRTYANKRLAEEKVKYEANKPAPGIAAEPFPYDELELELNGIEAHNLRYKNVIEGMRTRQTSLAEITNEIVALEEKIKALALKRDTVNKEIEGAEKWIKEPKNKLKTNADELKEKIAAIKESNKEVEQNNKAIAQKKVFDQSQQEAIDADVEVKKIEADKLEMIRLAALPEGFGFDIEGNVTYEGYTYNRQQLSTSKVYIAALKLAAMQLGEVKTLFFDASYLDKNSLQDVEIWAESEGLQLLIERPSWESEEISYEIIQDAKQIENKKQVAQYA